MRGILVKAYPQMTQMNTDEGIAMLSNLRFICDICG